ncbi:hypothetical protein [Natronobacterium texcoconense]|uniref:Uncharacterized protein n=1 Tax=Natronobacterium texcoconense TaxID=1095778 RepID=A0A1H1FYI3_NATTX|nr:hypothetical protein [Natronobacterium texcoconense]SDR05829.1 hypothetical protein SAMN04489842_2166 [Natronobacterium texcoconense]
MSKKGISALYGYTPFQLRNTEPYELLLPPISYLKAEDHRLYGSSSYRSHGTRDEYEVPLDEFDKTIVQPMVLNFSQFESGSESKVIYEKDSLDSRNAWQYPPVHMEYSHDSLSHTNHCRKAFVVASSKHKCPVRHQCPHQKNPQSEGGCSEYRHDGRYDRLYKVYPTVLQHYADSSGGEPERIGAVRYHDRPLFSLGLADKGEFRAFIDEVSFNSQPSYMWSGSVFLQEGIGFRMRQVSALELDFQEEVLTDLVLDVIDSSTRIEEWLGLKYLLYHEDKDQVDRKNGFNAFDKMKMGAAAGLKGDPNLGEQARRVDFEENEDARDFAEVTLLHTLSHLLRDRLCMRFGAEKDHLGYYFEHPASDVQTSTSNKTRIVVFETAVGGFGYLSEFAGQLADNGLETVADLITPVVEFLTAHEKDVQGKYSSLQSRNFEEEHAHAELMARAFTGLDSDHIYPHAKSVRRAVYEYLTEEKENEDASENVLDELSGDVDAAEVADDESRNSIRDILRDAPLCWDGCQHCVEETQECSFLTFDRPFVSSRSLGRGALSEILQAVDTPKDTFSSSFNTEGLLHDYLSFAREEVLIQSTELTPRFVEKIESNLLELDIDVTILTIESDSETADHSNAVQTCENLQETTSLTLVTTDEITENVLSIDGVCLVRGDLKPSTTASFNATIEVDFQPDSCSAFEDEFRSRI